MSSRASARRKRNRIITVIAAAGVAGVLIGILLAVLLGRDGYIPPVIQGVKEQIIVYEDDDIGTILLDGVTAVCGEDRPGQTFPVRVRVYEKGADREVLNYRAGEYRLVYDCTNGEKAIPVESVLIVHPADTEGPVIAGAANLSVTVGDSVSYRSGVTATDDRDGSVSLQVDAAQVDLTKPGTYPVTYSAVDSRGNKSTVTITVEVKEPEKEPSTEPPEGTDEPGGEGTEPDVPDVTWNELSELSDQVLAQILTPDMDKTQQARAIYDYTYNQVKYVGTSDKSSWVTGAYIGMTRGRGDCFNYFAVAKALLTRAGIPNIDVERVGGTTDHYWQLVNVGNGWYHFDACPHPTGYPVESFLITEEAARAYTQYCSPVRKNYYVYDYEACPVTVVGTPAEEPAPVAPPMEEGPAVDQPPAPLPPEDAAPVEIPLV